MADDPNETSLDLNELGPGQLASEVPVDAEEKTASDLATVFDVPVNISAVQLQQRDLVEVVRSALEESRLEPHMLQLEITESAAMQNSQQHLGALQALRNLGSRILIDDFGTGYSSLSYLKHLPIDTLKIDRAFVRDMAIDSNDAAIVRVKETDQSIAMSLDGNGRYCYLDPREGAKLAVAEACRNLATAGALPIAATNNLNFGNPERPEIMVQLVEAIEGMAEACSFFETPITGGNVSLYNETLGEAIYPTPVLGIIGLLKTGPPIPAQFTSEGASVVLPFARSQVPTGTSGGQRECRVGAAVSVMPSRRRRQPS